MRHSVKMESAGRQSRHIGDGELIVVLVSQILEKIAEVIQSIPQERISERTIEKIVHSVDPSCQSTAHAEACSVIVERVGVVLGAFPAASLPRAFLRLATATFATSSDVRVNEEIPAESAVFPVVERIVADSGIFQIFAR